MGDCRCGIVAVCVLIACARFGDGGTVQRSIADDEAAVGGKVLDDAETGGRRTFIAQKSLNPEGTGRFMLSGLSGTARVC